MRICNCLDAHCWHERKAARKEKFEKYVKGWSLWTCAACAGSGYYDSDGSPPCACCNGTGKTRHPPPTAEDIKKEFG